jgi:MoaA/NifB/PqqE/SkfB family radical SAM enzyme
MKTERPNKIKREVDSWGDGKTLWNKLRFYIPYAWRFIVLQQPEKLIYGIALTDRCNMGCQGCHVSNTGRPDMTWAELVNKMENAWERGFRELYFSGGEPMLWRDGEHTLVDLIAKAKQIGFFHVHVYTNGLFGVEKSADLVWVSMDGLPEIFKRRRGNHFHQVEHVVRESQHPKVAIIYVIDSNTAVGIESFLQWVLASEFPVIGVMFYFHTPYYGYDDLYLDNEHRAPIIDRLLKCIKEGLPILNSRAGLLALKSGEWPRRLPVASVLDVDGEFICCRASDEICKDCGYAACTEITEFQRLRLSAVIRMLRYW